MTSVKEMTWGSPEFVAVAKACENEGNTDLAFVEAVEKVLEMVDKSEMTVDCYDKQREKVMEAFDLHEECDCDCY